MLINSQDELLPDNQRKSCTITNKDQNSFFKKVMTAPEPSIAPSLALQTKYIREADNAIGQYTNYHASGTHSLFGDILGILR